MKRETKTRLQNLCRYLTKEKITRLSTMTDGFIIHIKDQKLVIEETNKRINNDGKLASHKTIKQN